MARQKAGDEIDVNIELEASSHSFIIENLPPYLQTSELIKQFAVDYPGQAFQIDDKERIFEIQNEISEDIIATVLDNYRYFEITDPRISYLLFDFFKKNVDLFPQMQNGFPELRTIWKSVELILDNITTDKLLSVCSEAAKNNLLHCLQYAHENGYPWDEITCLYAATNGYLECLQYAHENGCPWDEGTCTNAARYGHLDCLIYTHENGCPWNKATCLDAAMNGHLDCLQYAHENGCPWDADTCMQATMNGHLDCLQYAYGKGCPMWDAGHEDLRLLNFLNRNRAPSPAILYAIENGFVGISVSGL